MSELKVFELFLGTLTANELITKMRRASTRARELVYKRLSRIPERTLIVNSPHKSYKLPKTPISKKTGKKQKHFLELFNMVVIRINPVDIPFAAFHSFAMNLADLDLPKSVRIGVRIKHLDDTDK